MKIYLKTSTITFTLLFFFLFCFIVLIINFSTVSIIHIPVFENWWAFVDDLDTGSKIVPYTNFVTSDGKIEVTMVKAADPGWNDYNSSNKYPYVGIGAFFKRTAIPVDLSNVENIRLIYKLDGPVSIKLLQPDIEPGDEFIFVLPPAEDYNELVIKWSDFYQPNWVKNNAVLATNRITGISFNITTNHKNTAHLGIHSLTFFKKADD